MPHQVTTILALLNVPPKLYEALAPSSSAAGGRNDGARDGAELVDRQRKGKKTRREVSPRKAPQAQNEPSPRGSRSSSAKPARVSKELGGGGATTKRSGVKPPAPPDHTKDYTKEKDQEMKPSTPRGGAKEKPHKSMRARPAQFGVESNAPAARALRGSSFS